MGVSRRLTDLGCKLEGNRKACIQLSVISVPFVSSEKEGSISGVMSANEEDEHNAPPPNYHIIEPLWS